VLDVAPALLATDSQLDAMQIHAKIVATKNYHGHQESNRGPQASELGQPSYDGLLYRYHPRLYLMRAKQEN
jgi:hypothetical protein